VSWKKPKWEKPRVFVNRKTGELIVARYMVSVGWWGEVLGKIEIYSGIDETQHVDCGEL
jgi:hypothetical protein